jgi:dihydroflavonol-4-reductase
VAEIARKTGGLPGLDVKIPLRLAYFAAGFMPLYSRLTGHAPIFTRYALDALGSNSNIRSERARQELGYHPRPAGQTIADAMRWFQIHAERPSAGESQAASAEAAVGTFV